MQTAERNSQTPPEGRYVSQGPIRLRIELGRTRLDAHEAVTLEAGSVLVLDSDADAPLSVWADNRLIAHGQAVDVEGYFGVRVTQVSAAVEGRRL